MIFIEIIIQNSHHAFIILGNSKKKFSNMQVGGYSGLEMFKTEEFALLMRRPQIVNKTKKKIRIQRFAMNYPKISSNHCRECFTPKFPKILLIQFCFFLLIALKQHKMSYFTVLEPHELTAEAARVPSNSTKVHFLYTIISI